VKQIATMRASQVAARYGEHAPMATACCNACRTCVQTNILGIALGVLAAGGAAVKRAIRRA
jgi:TctA family transporter